jgi:hypothetical protein
VKRVLAVLMLAVLPLLLAACWSQVANSDKSGSTNGKTETSAQGATAAALNGKWMGGRAQTLEWVLADGKGTVRYTEDLAGPVDVSTAVDIAADGPDFTWKDLKGDLNPMRVRYLTKDRLIVEWLRAKPEGVQVIRSDPYARTKEAAQVFLSSMANATPGSHWDVAKRPGEQTYYERLVSQGLLSENDNLIREPR